MTGDQDSNVNHDDNIQDKSSGENSNKQYGSNQNADEFNHDQESIVDGNITGNHSEEKGESSQNEKTFTQDEVTRMMTREKKQGRNSVYNELGINPNDRRLIKIVKSFVSAQKDNESNNDSEPINEKLLKAEHRAKMAELKADILAAGVQPQYINDAVTLIAARMANDENLDYHDMISDLHKKYEGWFMPDKQQEDAQHHGTGSSIPLERYDNRSNSNDNSSLGYRLAASRKSKSNYSYFGKKKD